MISVHRNLTLSLPLFLSIATGEACNLASHPTDSELEQTLTSNQADFDALIRMLDEAKDIVVLDDKFVFLTEGATRKIPRERVDADRSLFAILELERSVQRDEDNALRFIASTGGIFSTSENSYIHSTAPLNPLVESLDHVIERDYGDQKTVYKKLHGDWYLYYASW